MNRGCDDGCRDRERQSNTKRAVQKSSERGARTEQDKQVVTEHGRRQYEWEGDERVDQIASGKVFAGQQPRESRTRHQRDQRGGGRNREGKPDGEPVDHRSRSWMPGAQASRLLTHESVRPIRAGETPALAGVAHSLSDLLRFVRLWLTIDGTI